MKFNHSESGAVYECPVVNVLEICPEGMLCDSSGGTEGVDENEGSWGTLNW